MPSNSSFRTTMRTIYPLIISAFYFAIISSHIVLSFRRYLVEIPMHFTSISPSVSRLPIYHNLRFRGLIIVLIIIHMSPNRSDDFCLAIS